MKNKLRKLRSLARAIVLLSAFSANAQSVNININADTVFQTMQGFGSSQRLFKDPHIIGGSDNDQDSTNGLNMTQSEQNEILDRLYRDLGLTRLRIAVYPMRVEPENDNSDPNQTDLSKFTFVWKMNDGFFDYVRNAKSRGLTTWWHSPVNLESWMNESNPEEYVEWAMAIIRRWRDKGLEFPYWSIINEPSYVRSGIWSGAYLRDVVKLLGAKLQSEGFKTGIVIPDDVRSTDGEAKAKVILADAEARKYVSALAFHLYDEPVTNVSKMKALGEQYGLPIWMSEYSVSDAFGWLRLMHDLIATYNVTAIDYLFSFGKGGYVDFNNNGTQYLGYVLSKKYYYTGQFSRFVKPGFQRIAANANNLTVKVTAYKSDTGIVIVAINNSHNPQTANFNFNGAKITSQINAVRSSASENWAMLSPVNGSATTFTSTLPANSITTFMVKTDLASGIIIQNKQTAMSIYPNPTQQTFTIELPDETFDIIMTDLTGRRVYEQKNISGKTQIDTKDFSAGMYFLQTTNAKIILNEKIVITK
jgi:O-glycosyl hydrolase